MRTSWRRGTPCRGHLESKHVHATEAVKGDLREHFHFAINNRPIRNIARHREILWSTVGQDLGMDSIGHVAERPCLAGHAQCDGREPP